MSTQCSIILSNQVDFTGWRTAARALATQDVPPEQTMWSIEESSDLFASDAPLSASGEAFSVSRAVIAFAETVIQANDAARFGLLYALIWRIHRGEKHLLEDAADPLTQRLMRLAAAVRRDTHKMRAFLRFRAVDEPEGTRHVAWFEPAHYIVEANAGFFVRRFATMRWTILTPYRSVHWDGNAVQLGPGARKSDLPDDDALEVYWRTYYASIFNPARLKLSAMTTEMPKKYWHNMPETDLIPELVRQAHERTAAMIEMPQKAPQRPQQRRPAPAIAADTAKTGHDALAHSAAECRRCGLWQHATQVVLGEGPRNARLMLIGEQPGDQEDLAGRPFVGPAGQLLNQAILAAGLDRAAIYITNAVKHFKFEPRGKRRIHATPDRAEIEACRPWLDAELELIKPAVAILLGASAARSILGRAVTISKERGQPIPLPHGVGLITVHPSYLLRLPNEEAKRDAYQHFVSDLFAANELLPEKK